MNSFKYFILFKLSSCITLFGRIFKKQWRNCQCNGSRTTNHRSRIAVYFINGEGCWGLVLAKRKLQYNDKENEKELYLVCSQSFESSTEKLKGSFEFKAAAISSIPSSERILSCLMSFMPVVTWLSYSKIFSSHSRAYLFFKTIL